MINDNREVVKRLFSAQSVDFFHEIHERHEIFVFFVFFVDKNKQPHLRHGVLRDALYSDFFKTIRTTMEYID